ncbi:MAG: hypothetical protein A3F83_10330 [Candidatus Glassbacteria bacterium RIFCSPLOWO2_12_FULL_58_11]|uniref:Glycosyltransferase 2-like domain-containing protein n=2 Tax=Candidatus Glassiibacteriota TaxID=1817805 RepID=A0A1F5YYT0_9BACT|nr:MAG: hypothetical protein A2Z86_10140 [Candidatus Glassbacteria bacterium GWA2_58_10]OGG05117.1 MAG: hypothetical protein A3F83_10330 [Candidatus Glassbacteria bacterium RIFCSPLOWO2_12_FULL_58_11]
MLEISAAIITLNAGETIRKTLAALDFTAEIVVVDSGSTDRTLDICREYGARIYSRDWEGFGRQKNWAIEQARCTWVLSLDADEEVSAELAREIRELDEAAPYDGYRLPRLNHYFGRPLYHGGQYPDLQLRLFRKGRGRYNERPVHEAVILEGRAGRLKGNLLHYSYGSIAEYLEKFQRYTRLEAERLHAEGERPGALGCLRRMVLAPCAKFIRRYIFKRGFLDGMPGFLAAALSSFTMIVSYARLWEKYQPGPAGPQRPDR